MRKKAFTLIELLVVISVIALLLSILMPALQKAKIKAREVICVSNGHQLGVAAITYETSNNRLPQHYTEAPNAGDKYATRASWQEQLASNDNNSDMRPLWKPYVGSLNFFNCPMLQQLDITLETIPTGASRVYGSYSFIASFYCDRSKDRSQGTSGWLKANRWTKTNSFWKYEGRKIEVLFADRLYRAFSIMNYRINHGQSIPGLAASYHPYNSRNGDSSQFAHSIFGGIITDPSVDLRKKASAVYTFKDGSAAKYAGSDSQMITLYDPPFSTTRQGEQLVPLR